MTPEFADLHSSMTAAEALDHIRLTGVDKETIDICYVIEKRRLIGLVSLRTLVLANARAVVSDLMDENVISVGTLDDIAVVADMFAKYDLTVMPVVDGENRLVGIVTVDDAIDVMRDEATEDIEKMGCYHPVGQTVSAAQRDGSVQKPHTVAAAFDAFSGFHTADNRKIRSCACSKHHPDIVHPDADGHGAAIPAANRP